MKKLFSAKLAGNILFASLGLLLVFHILVLLKIVPANIIWGGQVTASNFLTLELVAIFVTVLFAGIVAAKAGYIKAGKWTVAVNIGMWLVFVFLVLNTLGNLASGISTENLVFAPITIFLAFCALRLAVEK